jgi:glycine/D-amino acid oxidase-like deaminating enzyme
MPERSVVIVGAGAMGAAAALELRGRGWAVTLTDPGPIPHPMASSTDISKMVRADYGADAFYADLCTEALRRWRAWNATWSRPLYHETGFVIMARGALGPGGFEHESYQTLLARGFPLERLDARALAERYPAWNAERYPDGYVNHRAGWAESGEVVRRLVEQSQALGANVRPGFQAASLLEAGGRVTGVRAANGAEEKADHVLVAAGAWTPALLPELADVMWPVAQPVYHLAPEGADAYGPPRFLPWAADIAGTGWYGFPVTADGIVKIGNHGPGTRCDPNQEQALPQGAEAHVRAFVRETFPALADAPLVGGRQCLYCDTFDGDLWVDRHPDRPGLAVATGGSGHGFKMVPVLGELIADLLEEKPNPWAARFGWRSPGERRWEDARYPG